MQRLTAFLAAAMLMTAGLPAAAAVAQQSPDPGVQPGARFAGAVGVQGAEVEGEIEGRALDRRFAAADSNASRAAVVAAESRRASERLAALRERRATLRERYKNGELSKPEYHARLASVAAESAALERRLNETAAAARSLPPAVAREHGVNASALETLRADADSLNDGEAGEAARNIAGQGVGNGLGGPPNDAGPRGNNSGGTHSTDTAGPPDDSGNGDGVGDGAGNGSSSSGRSDAGDDASTGTSGAAGGTHGNDTAGGDSSTGGGPPDDGETGQDGSAGGGSDTRGGDSAGGGGGDNAGGSSNAARGGDADGEGAAGAARIPGDGLSRSR